MKNFLKLFAVILLIAFSIELFAQNFGVKAGLNLSEMVIKDDDMSIHGLKTNLGFNLGVTAEFPITTMFSFETGLMLNTKGFRIIEKVTILQQTMELKAKKNIFYLDIPLTAKLGFDVGGARIYALAGPYVGFGLSGKMKEENIVANIKVKTTEDVKFGSKNNETKRLDYGLLFGAGVEFGHITLGASYGLGLANISNYSDNGYKESHRVTSISVGYKF